MALIGSINNFGQSLTGFVVGMRGLKGDKGDQGDKGDTGNAATVTVGSTTTGAAGTSASVTNSGDTHNAVFDFTIPKGDKGETGDINTYIAEYNSTTYAEIGSAISAGKYVVALYNNNYYPLIMFSNSSYVFSYTHENICYEVVCDSYSTWTARTHTSVRDVKQNGASVTTSGVALVTTPQPTTTTPKMDGTAAVGSETTWAKGDHVHPTDTSRVPETRTVNGKALSSDVTLDYSDVGAVPTSREINGYALTSDITLDADDIGFDEDDTYSADTVGKGIQDRILASTIEELMPKDTASGAIASFPDGQAIFPLEKCLVSIDPVQDLNGYDKPWIGGSGKNKLPLRAAGSTGTILTATFTYNDDGTITLNGTPTSNATVPITSSNKEDNKLYLPAGTYIVSGIDGISTETFIGVNVNSTSGAYTARSNIDPQFTVTEGDYIYVRIRMGQGDTLNNYVVKPMIRLASESDTWQPYENICPISGWSEVNATVEGVNAWDEAWEVGSINSSTGANANDNTTIRAKNHIKVRPNTEYYFNTANNNMYLFAYDENDTYIGRFDQNGLNGTNSIKDRVVTTPSGTYSIRFRMHANYGTTYNNDISINYPSTDTSYHAYDSASATCTTSLGTTVYGGTLDAVSGKLTINKAIVDLGSLSYTYVSTANYQYFWANVSGMKSISSGTMFGLSDRFDWKGVTTTTDIQNNPDNTIGTYNGQVRIKCSSYTDKDAFKTAMNGAQFCYELATPITTTLTGQQVQTLLGQNHVFCDSGDVEVRYVADIQRYIDKKTDELSVAILALS